MGTYFLEWLFIILNKWENFFRDNVGPLLAAHFRGTSLADRIAYVDPVSALIRALLPVIEEKVQALLVDISAQPQYLSKFISQLLAFDERLNRDYDYFDVINTEKEGVASRMLDRWFDEWLKAEKSFAFERYHEIVEAPQHAAIDYESSDVGNSKPTHAAILIGELLRNITGQYDKLQRISFKLRFLLNLQLKLLGRYHLRLTEALGKYHALTSYVGRTVHGFTREEQATVEGVAGLEVLCKILGSADYIIRTLREMSNEQVGQGSYGLTRLTYVVLY